MVSTSQMRSAPGRGCAAAFNGEGGVLHPVPLISGVLLFLGLGVSLFLSLARVAATRAANMLLPLVNWDILHTIRAYNYTASSARSCNKHRAGAASRPLHIRLRCLRPPLCIPLSHHMFSIIMSIAVADIMCWLVQPGGDPGACRRTAST